MRKKATRAAAKQPDVTTSQPDGESAPGAVDTQPVAGAPEAATTEVSVATDEQSEVVTTEATPTEVSTAAATPDEDNSPKADSVELEVVTALPRRIRAGVVVTNEPQRVHVSEAVAAELEADPQVKVVRK